MAYNDPKASAEQGVSTQICPKFLTQIFPKF